MICITIIALILNSFQHHQSAKFLLFALNSTSIWVTYQVFNVDYSVLTSYFPILFCFPLFFDYASEKWTIGLTALFISACLITSFLLPKHLFYTIILEADDASISNLFHIVISFVLTILVVFVVVRNWNRTKIKLVEERKKAEDRLSDLTSTQYQLIKSEKMASLGVLITGISHEMNNPLNFVKQSTEFLQKALEEPIDDAMKQEYLRILEIGVDRLTSIVKSLNSFNYSTLEKKKDLSLSAILDNCISIIKNNTSSKVRFEVKLDDSLEINGNEAQLHQVFLNLINNAEQAIDGNGTIAINTKIQKSKALVQIEDNGEGIPEEIKTKIFDPFFTTRDPGKGVGLGLCIAQEFIRNVSGEITISSTVGSGTLVEVEVPCRQRSQLSLLDAN